jgi:dTDP-4-dehydrorhamnose reductase
LIPTDRDTLDVTVTVDPKDYFGIDAIIHCAAITDHHKAEIEQIETYDVNVCGTENMVELARKLDVPIVYIGTCGMYDGLKDSYSEDDEPTPLNHYGTTKHYGELAVQQYEKHYITRCGWGMGGGLQDKKFINLIYRLSKVQDTIHAINDVYGSPTYFIDFAIVIQEILENKIEYGTYNIGGDRASRYDVAKHFFECIGSGTKVIPISKEDYHKIYPLKVPYTNCEVLNTDKIKKTGLFKMRHWKDALAEYAKDFK